MSGSDSVYRRGLLPYYRLFVPSWFWVLLAVMGIGTGDLWLSVAATAIFSALVAVSVLEHRRGYLRFVGGTVTVHRAFRPPVEFSLSSARASFVRRPASYVRLLTIREGTRSVKVRSVADVISPLQRSMTIRPAPASELRDLGLHVTD